MTADVTVTYPSRACRVELSRPGDGNLVTMEMVAALTHALETITSDVSIVVIAGQGKDFCKGRDYRAAPESAAGRRDAPTALRIREEMTRPMMAFYTALRDLAVPTLSIVQGAAYGFGCALAGACDMTLAGESALFRLPEMERGLPPTLAMSALWDRIPLRSMAYMVYSTAELSAADAAAIGLVSAVVPDKDLYARGNALLDIISSQSLDAVKAVKEYLREAPSMPSAGRGAFGASLFATVLASR
jgi:enoyl-CoA hydratase/carnithine racemase